MSRKVRSDKIIFNKSDIRKMEKLAALGFTIEQIACFFDISRDTLYRRCNEPNSELSATLLRGRTRSIQKIAEKAFNLALEGDVQMIKYILSCKGGWRDNSQINSEQGFLGLNTQDIEMSSEINLSECSDDELRKLQEFIKFQDSLPKKYSKQKDEK